MIGIYKITSPTNRVYIGQSVDIDRRFRFYKHLNCKGQPILFSSLTKYGVDSHTFEIIEVCPISELNLRERYWQDYFNVLDNGLNCYLVESDIEPKMLSEETKNKISNSHKGKKFTETHKRNLSITKSLICNGSDNSFFGKHHTEEYKLNKSTKCLLGGNPNAKIVLNIETGIYYDSCKEAANTCNISYATLTSWLRGQYKNKSSFIYV